MANAFVYDAYGTLIASNSTPQTAYLYCAEQNDLDLGLYYLRARYLSPNTGRFWTMDTEEGHLHEPLSLHKYLYCSENPVNHIDPSGHDLADLMLSTSIGAGLDATYNGTVLNVGNALQGTIMGIQQGYTANQILGQYLVGTGIGLAGGILISKAIGVAGEAIYGGEVGEFTGSTSTASRAAAYEANEVLEGQEAAVTEAGAGQEAGASRGFGYLDKMLPGTLKEGDIIYSTVPPDKINAGLWATDARALVRSQGSSDAYQMGTQTTKARSGVFAYRVKTKVPCAAGNAEANFEGPNNTFREGGYPQYYIRQDDIGNLEPVGYFPFNQ